MIDNVVLIVTGTLHERDVHELLEKCHPLGMFDRFDPWDYLGAPWFGCIVVLWSTEVKVIENITNRIIEAPA